MTDQKRYYKAHGLKIRVRRKLWYIALKRDPVAYAAFIERARLYKRKVFGWKRTYKPRRQTI